MSKFKITITGATGFIGGNVLKYLAELGYELDTINSTEFMMEDWKRLDDFKLSLEGDRPTHVIHCAWTRCKDLHDNEHMEFAEHTTNFFDQCARRGIKVINMGSSSEYGVKDEAMREDMMCEPISSYGIAKLATTLYAKKLGFNTLRIFTAYGEGGHSFMDNWEKSEKYTSPNHIRHYVSVKLIAIAVERLMHAQHLYGEIINIAEPYKILKNSAVALPFKDMVNFDSIADAQQSIYNKWYRYPQRQHEPLGWEANINKLQQLLNL